MITALITGGNRGLGFAVAQQLLNEKHRVILATRDSNKLGAAIEKLTATYNKELVHGVLCDVSNKESVQLLKGRLQESFDQVDLLVNNAGIINNQQAFPTTTVEEISHTINTNVYGPYRVTQACLPLLERSSQAMIINVSSGMGAHNEAGGGYTAYRISKFALNGLTDLMQRELLPKGIKVVSVCPGWVHTDMGGSNAPRTPEEGANSILAPFRKNLDGGKFYRDGKLIAW